MKLIIYHSRGAFPARLAAAMHMGRLAPAPPADKAGLEAALAAVGGGAALGGAGLWSAGTDPTGCRVYALGRASRPEVAHRAFHAMAALAGIAPGAFRLRNAGPAIALRDLLVRLLRLVGANGLAHGLMLQGLRRDWTRAAAAVAPGEPLDDGPPPPPTTALHIIYHCYGGAHSSITTANIHLGHLPRDRRPSPREILHQPRFDRAESDEIGTLQYMGADEAGRGIYVMGLAGGKRPMCQALTDFLTIAGAAADRYQFEETLRSAGAILRIGGYTSRGLGWVAVGRPLCALGVWLKYHRFAEHVRRVSAHPLP